MSTHGDTTAGGEPADAAVIAGGIVVGSAGAELCALPSGGKGGTIKPAPTKGGRGTVIIGGGVPCPAPSKPRRPPMRLMVLRCIMMVAFIAISFL